MKNDKRLDIRVSDEILKALKMLDNMSAFVRQAILEKLKTVKKK